MSIYTNMFNMNARIACPNTNAVAAFWDAASWLRAAACKLACLAAATADRKTADTYHTLADEFTIHGGRYSTMLLIQTAAIAADLPQL